MGDILHKKSWSNKPNKLIQPRSHTIHNAFKHSYYSEKCCNKQLINHPVTNNVLLMQMSANIQGLGEYAIVSQEVSMYLNLAHCSTSFVALPWETVPQRYLLLICVQPRH